MPTKSKSYLFTLGIAAGLMLAALLTQAACVKAVALHPGAINAFDSISADTLLTAQKTIEDAKTKVGSNTLARSILTKTIASYNTTETAYVSYHTLAKAGGNPDPTVLQTEIAQLIGSVAQLVTQIKGATK